MSKFYRVKKDTFMWKKGAILEYDNHRQGLGMIINPFGYVAVEDLWDRFELNECGIPCHIVEAPENSDWFERVYEMSWIGKNLYVGAAKARQMADKMFLEHGEEIV